MGAIEDGVRKSRLNTSMDWFYLLEQGLDGLIFRSSQIENMNKFYNYIWKGLNWLFNKTYY